MNETRGGGEGSQYTVACLFIFIGRHLSDVKKRNILFSFLFDKVDHQETTQKPMEGVFPFIFLVTSTLTINLQYLVSFSQQKGKEKHFRVNGEGFDGLDVVSLSQIDRSHNKGRRFSP